MYVQERSVCTFVLLVMTLVELARNVCSTYVNVHISIQLAILRNDCRSQPHAWAITPEISPDALKGVFAFEKC